MGYSMSRERKRARINFLRKVIALLFLCCVVLLIADIVCMIVLINGGKKSKKSTSDTSATIESSVDPSASDSESETTPPTETTPAPVEVKEYLPENALAESYWGPLPDVTEVKPVQHNDVRGIYIAAAMRLDENIELASRSDINAFVIDLKDEGGGILYNSDIQFAKDMKLYNYKCNKDGSDPSWEDKGSYIQNAYNLDSIVEKCHQNGIKVIGRIVCFNDLSLARNHPEMSIVDANGNTMRFKLEGYKQFVNPYDTKVWDFLIEIAQEAISKGVDEIQFDYVRFPTISTKSGEAPYFGPEDTTPTRIDAINRFLQTARRKIQDPTGIPVTADVFGIILSSELDGKLIGQGWSTVGLTGVDAVCPMLYPSHYALNTQLNGKTFDKPDKYPYEVMFNALMAGKSSADQEGYATVRPYVQAFTASYIGKDNYLDYTEVEIKKEIQAIYDAGYTEWLLWNAAAKYANRFS